MTRHFSFPLSRLTFASLPVARIGRPLAQALSKVRRVSLILLTGAGAEHPLPSLQTRSLPRSPSLLLTPSSIFPASSLQLLLYGRLDRRLLLPRLPLDLTPGLLPSLPNLHPRSPPRHPPRLPRRTPSHFPPGPRRQQGGRDARGAGREGRACTTCSSTPAGAGARACGWG